MSHDGQDVLVRRVPQDVALYEPGKCNYTSVIALRGSPIGEFSLDVSLSEAMFKHFPFNKLAKKKPKSID
jgi:hypothetical protein